MNRKYLITLLEHEDGVSVSCPELTGCHSQGETVQEALENIADAIREYVEVFGLPDARFEVREVEVAVAVGA